MLSKLCEMLRDGILAEFTYYQVQRSRFKPLAPACSVVLSNKKKGKMGKVHYSNNPDGKIKQASKQTKNGRLFLLSLCSSVHSLSAFSRIGSAKEDNQRPQQDKTRITLATTKSWVSTNTCGFFWTERGLRVDSWGSQGIWPRVELDPDFFRSECKFRLSPREVAPPCPPLKASLFSSVKWLHSLRAQSCLAGPTAFQGCKHPHK